MGVEAGLQSGFVIGVVVAALLLADRLGGASAATTTDGAIFAIAPKRK